MTTEAVTAIVACAYSSFVDLREGRIPDAVTYPAFALLMLVAVSRGTFVEAIVGASVSGGILAVMNLATRGRGIGWGDVKLAVCIGAALGPQLGIVVLGCGFVSGAALGIILVALRRASPSDRIAFAPHLTVGTIAAVVGGAWIFS